MPRSKRYPLIEHEDEVISLRLERVSISVIAEKFGVTRQAVSWFVRKRGVFVDIRSDLREPRYPRKCKTCGTSMRLTQSQKKRRRYCSRECAGIGLKKQVEYKCTWCGNKFTRIPSRMKRTLAKKGKIMCGNQCVLQYMWSRQRKKNAVGQKRRKK